jgi:hypothetical protein
VTPRPAQAPTLLSLSLVWLSVFVATGCKVDANEFQARVFDCDTASASPLCGTDQAGAPMTCFAARQLGGTDFCTKSCGDAPMSLPDENAVCVQGKAKLQACAPSDGDGACGRPEFGCLRTDVMTDEGICVTMKPCQQDTDCHDPVRSTCASTFFAKLYSNAKNKIQTDHLYCLQEGCQRDRTACSPGETCLKDVIPAAAHPPDICVPKCNSSKECPPNFLCLQKDTISGPANPGVCIPGLLGFKCESDVDCLVGRCLSDGGDKLIDGSVALNLCTVDCDSDADCQAFDSEQGLFFCNADHHCATPSAYLGASCNTQADCTRDPLTTACVFLTDDPKDQGTCVHPCPADGACPALGGVPHTCLGKSGTSPGVCFPGQFGLPCAADANCAPGLKCRDAFPGVKLCTALCQKDADCDDNRFAAGQGFCGGAVCLPLGSLPLGSPCSRTAQCKNAQCIPNSAMSGAMSTCGGK